MRIFARADGALLGAVATLQPGDADQPTLTPSGTVSTLTFDSETNGALASDIDADIAARAELANAPSQIASWTAMRDRRAAKIASFTAAGDTSNALIATLTADIATLNQEITALQKRVADAATGPVGYRLTGSTLTKDGATVTPAAQSQFLADRQQVQQAANQIDTFLQSLDAGTNLTAAQLQTAIKILLRVARFVLRWIAKRS